MLTDSTGRSVESKEAPTKVDPMANQSSDLEKPELGPLSPTFAEEKRTLVLKPTALPLQVPVCAVITILPMKWTGEASARTPHEGEAGVGWIVADAVGVEADDNLLANGIVVDAGSARLGDYQAPK